MKKKITAKWLRQQRACPEGVEWFERNKDKSIADLLRLSVENGKYGYVQFFIEHALNKMESVRLSIYAAKAYLRMPSDGTRSAANSAALKKTRLLIVEKIIEIGYL